MKYQDNIKAVLHFMEDKLYQLTTEGNLYGYNIEFRNTRVQATVFSKESECRVFFLYDCDVNKEDGWKAVNEWERRVNDYIVETLCDRLDKSNASAAAFEVECNNLKQAAAL